MSKAKVEGLLGKSGGSYKRSGGGDFMEYWQYKRYGSTLRVYFDPVGLINGWKTRPSDEDWPLFRD